MFNRIVQTEKSMKELRKLITGDVHVQIHEIHKLLLKTFLALLRHV